MTIAIHCNLRLHNIAPLAETDSWNLSIKILISPLDVKRAIIYWCTDDLSSRFPLWPTRQKSYFYFRFIWLNDHKHLYLFCAALDDFTTFKVGQPIHFWLITQTLIRTSVGYVSAVMWSNSVPTFSKIEQSATELCLVPTPPRWFQSYRRLWNIMHWCKMSAK